MRRLDNIDLRLLRVFMTIVEVGGVSAAQIALNLSQSTLSMHLAALEQNLGGKLCQRGRKGFRLTSFGEATYKASKQLFGEIDRFQQQLDGFGSALVGRLRIGVVDGVVSNPGFRLQAVIDRYMERGRNVFLDLQLGTPHDLEQSVADGMRDIVLGPFSQKAPGVTYFPLHSEPHALYCGRGHALFEAPAAEVTIEAIGRSPFSVRSYRHLEDLYRVDHRRASGSVLQMEAQLLMILSGRFVGFLPCHIAEPFVAGGEIRALRPETFQFRSLHLGAYRREDAERPVVAAFLDELKREVRAEAARVPANA